MTKNGTSTKPKRWKESLHGIGGLSYILFKNIPMRESKFGPVIEINEAILEDLAARALIEYRVPLRGLEVKFLRKVLQLSMDAFSEKLGLTAGAVFKWEQKSEEKLHPINEIAVRAFVADSLGIEISGKFSEMVSHEKTPKEIVLKAG